MSVKRLLVLVVGAGAGEDGLAAVVVPPGIRVFFITELALRMTNTTRMVQLKRSGKRS